MPSSGDIFKLSQKFETDSNDLQYNVYDFLVASGTCTDAELLLALTGVMEAAYGEIDAVVSSEVNAQEGIVHEMTWSGTKWLVDRYVGQILPDITFTNVNQTLPFQTSGLVSFLTTKPRVVLKKYLPVFSEDSQQSSVLVGTVTTAMLAFGTELLDSVPAGSAFLAYVARLKDGTTWGPWATVAETIISSQRRRKPGVGV